MDARVYRRKKYAFIGSMDPLTATTKTSELEHRAQAVRDRSNQTWTRAKNEYKNAITSINQKLQQQQTELEHWASVEAIMAKMISTSSPRTTQVGKPDSKKTPKVHAHAVQPREISNSTSIQL